MIGHVSIYQGDGFIKDGDWQPDGLKSINNLETITWSAKQNSRIELPAHILRNFYKTEGIVGLHFSYAGEGNIGFKPPHLVDYLRQRRQFAHAFASTYGGRGDRRD